MIWVEKDILDGINKGDRKAFDLVFKRYYSGLCTFAFDFLRSYELSEEITQEVFLSLWENHQKIQIKSSLQSYLYRSVHNRALNVLRRQQQTLEIPLEQLEIQLASVFSAVPEDTFDAAFNEQMESEMEGIIQRLPEQGRKIFMLCRYENNSYPEIAKKLDISLSTVKTQMSRSMSKLREGLDKYFE